MGGTVASWLVRSTPERVVRVGALAEDIVLCSWARHFTLTLPLSTQVYKWVLANCWGNLTNCGEVTCNGLASHSGGSRNALERFMLNWNQDKLWPYEPAVFTQFLHRTCIDSSFSLNWCIIIIIIIIISIIIIIVIIIIIITIIIIIITWLIWAGLPYGSLRGNRSNWLKILPDIQGTVQWYFARSRCVMCNLFHFWNRSAPFAAPRQGKRLTMTFQPYGRTCLNDRQHTLATNAQN